MRIVQIIDSLDVGGAERMAVNYANALSKKVSFSGLIATRKEGNLKNELDHSVHYLFLNRKGTIDWRATKKLKQYCKDNDVEWLQPHSSSYFIAVMVKLLHPKIKIIWHDHNGLSEFLGSQKWIPLKLASFFFKGIIVVNFRLKNWAVKELFCKHVICLPNFTENSTAVTFETQLKGVEGKKILCLANLRDQKNHFLLLKVAKTIKKTHSDWSFHLVGKDFNDAYSQLLNEQISIEKLEEMVFLYGTRNDIQNIISQSTIAILTSKSEGLPVALLEYGLSRKPVVVTNVGEMPLIINDGINGYMVGSDDDVEFAKKLIKLIENPALRDEFGRALHATILQNNSEAAVVGQYLDWIETRLC